MATFKNEVEANKALQVHINEIHTLLDRIFAGIIEPGRSSNSSGNNVTIFTGDSPSSALSKSLKDLLQVISNLNTTFRVNVNLLRVLFIRILSVQMTSPLKDANTRTLKSCLPLLHTVTWNALAEFCQVLEPKLLCNGLSMLLKYFVTRYHTSLTADTEGRPLLASIFTFLSHIHEDSLISTLSAPISKNLLELAITVLSKEKSSNNHGKGVLQQRSNKAKDEKINSSSSPHKLVSVTLNWLHVALSSASFQITVSEGTRAIIFTTLFQQHLSEHPLVVLDVLAACVLNQQPSYLSPHLSMLIRIIRSAIHSKDVDIRNTGLRYADCIDFLIRPRRPYPPRSKIVAVKELEVVTTTAAATVAPVGVVVDKEIFASKDVLAAVIEPVVEPIKESAFIRSTPIATPSILIIPPPVATFVPVIIPSKRAPLTHTDLLDDDTLPPLIDSEPDQ